MPEIILENLCKDFDGHKAADNMNLRIEDGEYICILGPTGAGKTTCMRMICGLTRPDSGRILLDGVDVTELSPDMRNATMLSQAYSLFPHMNVFENIIFAPMIKEWSLEESQQIVKSMLHLVHLEQKAKWMPDELSGGQQQRIALARALASGSKVLLLDEPLRALDARLKINIRKELRSLVKEMGLTCIHVTHEQDEALEMADRIAVLRDGKIIQFGTPREVFDNPSTPFVANFVGRSNVVVGKYDSEGFLTTESGLRVPCRKGSLNDGDEAVMAVKIGATRLCPDGEGVLSGIIERVLYEGVTITVEILVDGVGIVSVKLPNRRYDDVFPGTRTGIIWNPEHAPVFPMPEYGLENEMRLD